MQHTFQYMTILIELITTNSQETWASYCHNTMKLCKIKFFVVRRHSQRLGPVQCTRSQSRIVKQTSTSWLYMLRLTGQRRKQRQKKEEVAPMGHKNQLLQPISWQGGHRPQLQHLLYTKAPLSSQPIEISCNQKK